MNEQELATKAFREGEFYDKGDDIDIDGVVFEVVDVEKREPRRWCTQVTFVVRSSTGRYWASSYDRGNTEMQDSTDFEPAYEVQPVTRTIEVTSFERVKQEAQPSAADTDGQG